MSKYIDERTMILITKTDSGISKIDKRIRHGRISESACVIQIQKRTRSLPAAGRGSATKQ